MTERRNDSGSTLEATVQPPSAPGTDGHDEWLLDESIEETFPASDPMLPVRPGSNLSERNALWRRDNRIPARPLRRRT